MTGDRYRGRLKALKELLRERRIAALLVTQRENIRYLTGFTGSSGSILITPGRTCLITDFRYQLQASTEVRSVPVVILKSDWAAGVGEISRRYGVHKLWFEDPSMTMDRIRALRRTGLSLAGAGDPVAVLRKLKDRAELAAIRKAIRRAEESFVELRGRMRPGITEQETALRLEFLMRGKGARRAAFDTIVASGKNGALPHAKTTSRRIRRGDLVTIDFGSEADGYYCDITRTICVGAPTVRQRRIHAIVLEAQRAAVALVRPQVPCREIDAAARTIISQNGLGNRFGHALGHGVGMMVHEGPSLAARSRETLEPGMVLTVEPGIYIPGWGGVRIEDMVLVTPNGASLLTTLPQGLAVA